MSAKITKKEAWAPRPDECKIPIDKTVWNFHFTRKWFVYRNLMTFSTFLPKKFDGSKPVNMIQIGVFEGMDLIWNLQNTLKHPESRVLAIDPWAATRKLDADYMEDCYTRARHNLDPYANKVSIKRGYSQELLREAINKPTMIGGKAIPAGKWDLIIIDGDHNAPAVFEDAMLSYELVRVGGWLLFDDVRNQKTKKNHVQQGLDDFMDMTVPNVKRVWYHRYCDCLEKLN